MPKPANTLICTVGTSLLRPNLTNLPDDAGMTDWLDRQPEGDRPHLAPATVLTLREAHQRSDWDAVGKALPSLPPTTRLLGAEINSVASMLRRDYAKPNTRIVLCHSHTEDGDSVARLLRAYFEASGHPVDTRRIPDLQDSDPRRFRTRGLRNLAKEVCELVRTYGVDSCAINATGGYKAQIAVAVVLGQALGVPVYYKHELFDEVVAFPPLPVALDFRLWMRVSGLLFDLAGADARNDLVSAESYSGLLDERVETLVERVDIDGDVYLELSPTGQIFHETFRLTFQDNAPQLRAAQRTEKLPPRLERDGHLNRHKDIVGFMKMVTDEVDFVTVCSTFYYNPDLTERTLFKMSAEGPIGVFSRRGWTVKFGVGTTARTDREREAAVAYLNDWLSQTKLCGS